MNQKQSKPITNILYTYIKIIMYCTCSNLIACCHGNAILDERVVGNFDFPAVHPTKLIYTRFGDYQSPRIHLIYPTREIRTFKYAYRNGRIRNRSSFVLAQCLYYNISELKTSVQTRYYSTVINIWVQSGSVFFVNVHSFHSQLT